MTNDILGKVKAPAIGILITGVINSVWGIISIISNIYQFVTKQGTFAHPFKADAVHFGAIIGILVPIISLVASPFVIYGAIQMMKGRKYGLSKTAAILAIIPFTSCCFLIGIPFGIWALVVLSKPDVKAVFNGETPSEQFIPPPPPQNW